MPVSEADARQSGRPTPLLVPSAPTAIGCGADGG
jgi:hypothetical protein